MKITEALVKGLGFIDIYKSNLSKIINYNNPNLSIYTIRHETPLGNEWKFHNRITGEWTIINNAEDLLFKMINDVQRNAERKRSQEIYDILNDRTHR